jgi:S1-C subfamily serine protease
MLALVTTLALAASFDAYDHGRFYEPEEVLDEVVHDALPAVVRMGSATGFVVSPHGLVITNHHVTSSFGASGVAVLADHGGAFDRVVRLQLVRTEPDIDAALYRMIATHDPLPWIELRPTPARQGEVVAVLGHPDGQPLRVTYGQVMTPEAEVAGTPSVEYSAPTWYGSSGSPVIDPNGFVVAIHWGWDMHGTLNGLFTGIPAHLVLDAFPELKDPRRAACLRPDVWAVDTALIEESAARNELGQALDEVTVSLITTHPECMERIEAVRWQLHPTFGGATMEGTSVRMRTEGRFLTRAVVALADDEWVLVEGDVAW